MKVAEQEQVVFNGFLLFSGITERDATIAGNTWAAASAVPQPWTC